MAEDLRVRGGPGGVAADLTDMRRVADELDRAGSRLRVLAAQARRLTLDGDLLASTVLSPGTAAAATAQLLDAAFGPQGTTSVAVTLELGAVGLRGVAGLFEARDRAADGLADLREDLLATSIGSAAIPAGAGAYLAHLAAHTDRRARQVAAGLLRGELSVGEAVEHLAGSPGAAWGTFVDDLQRLLIAHPQLTDVAVGGLPHLLGALSPVPGGASAFLGGVLVDDYETLTSHLIRIGQSTPGLRWFRDGEVVVTRTIPRGHLDLDGLFDVFTSQLRVHAGVVDDPDRSAVRVIEVPGQDGSAWIVQVPGTQEWAPGAGGDPSDVTTNLLLEAHHDAAILDGVATAMRRSGIRPDDPVLLTGHSQGGIAAAAFAAHAEHGTAFNVTHVITAGSPIGRIPLPEDVQVLAFEHDEDPVPRLEGDPNPAAPNVVTVSRSVAGQAFDDAGRPDVIRAHRLDIYRHTAALATDLGDPGVDRIVDSLAPFLRGEGTATDHLLERTTP